MKREKFSLRSLVLTEMGAKVKYALIEDVNGVEMVNVYTVDKCAIISVDLQRALKELRPYLMDACELEEERFVRAEESTLLPTLAVTGIKFAGSANKGCVIIGTMYNSYGNEITLKTNRMPLGGDNADDEFIARIGDVVDLAFAYINGETDMLEEL